MREFAEIAAADDPGIFQGEPVVAHDFIYRPLFLKIKQYISSRPLGGRLDAECGFALGSRKDLILILSLLRWIFGKPEKIGNGGSPGSCILELERGDSRLGAKIAFFGGLSEATGSGQFRLGAAELSYRFGERDCLQRARNGTPAGIIPLPEGTGRYYAILDEAECRNEGRASRIFPGKAALACALFLREPSFGGYLKWGIQDT